MLYILQVTITTMLLLKLTPNAVGFARFGAKNAAYATSSCVNAASSIPIERVEEPESSKLQKKSSPLMTPSPWPMFSSGSMLNPSSNLMNVFDSMDLFDSFFSPPVESGIMKPLMDVIETKV